MALVNELLHADETIGTGRLWNLADSLALADLSTVVDGMDPLQSDEGGFDRRSWEVGSFYARILVRAWRGPGAFDPARALGWLRKRVALGGQGESRVRDLCGAMRDTPDRLRRLASHFFSSVPLDEGRWLAYHRFREAILFQLNADTLADVGGEQMEAAATRRGRPPVLHQLSLSV